MIRLFIQNMTCGHCAGMITKAIRAVDGHARIELNLEMRRVAIESERNAKAFITAIIAAGYVATIEEPKEVGA